MKKQNKNSLVETKNRVKTFALFNEPQAYTISLHINNMIASLGEDYVKSVIWELFFARSEYALKNFNKNKKAKTQKTKKLVNK